MLSIQMMKKAHFDLMMNNEFSLLSKDHLGFFDTDF